MRLIIGRRSLSLLALLLLTAATPQTAITGELVETYCYAVMQIGGPAHRACAIECAKRGIPIAIVDAATRKSYVLLPGKDKAKLPPQVIEAMGERVTIRGRVVTRGGNQFLTVDSITRKTGAPSFSK